MKLRGSILPRKELSGLAKAITGDTLFPYDLAMPLLNTVAVRP